MASLKLFQTFSSWKEFFDAVSSYCSENKYPFVKSSCKTCVQANKHVKEGHKPYPLDMKYVYYTYTCTHSGSFKPSGNGKRATKSNKQACGAKIYACLDKKDRTRIVIKQLIEEHNHEISAHIFERYAKQRRLTESEKAKAEELVRLNVPPKDLRREIVRLTGKPVIMQDVHNIKKCVRQKDKLAASNGNDAQLLAVECDKMREKDPGLISDYGVNDGGTLQYVFIQSSEMRETFKRFPEHVLVDCTYCVNDRDMPLLSFLVIDGNSKSRLCAFALIANESAPMLTEIFTKFKFHNPESSSIKTFMVDKDLNEVARLEEVFPDAFCELCLFHVKKAFKKKIDSLQASSAVKMEIRLLVEKLCNAKSIHQYDELKAELLLLHQPFSQYFIDHWDNMRERWVWYARAEHLNFGDSTNNRIESYHQKLKSVITSPAPLDVCLKKIMFLYQSMFEEIVHLNFLNVTKKSFTQFPEIQKFITPHALTLAASEVTKASEYDVRWSGLLAYVSARNDVNKCHETEGVSCTCHTFRSLLMPCRHIIAVRRDKGEEPLVLSLFHKRWFIDYNRWATHENTTPASPSVSSFDWRTCAMDKKDRYGLAKPQLDRLLHLLVELGQDRLTYYLDLLQVFEEKVSECKRFFIVDDGVEEEVQSDVIVEEVGVGSAADDGAGATSFEVVSSGVVSGDCVEIGLGDMDGRVEIVGLGISAEAGATGFEVVSSGVISNECVEIGQGDVIDRVEEVGLISGAEATGVGVESSGECVEIGLDDVVDRVEEVGLVSGAEATGGGVESSGVVSGECVEIGQDGGVTYQGVGGVFLPIVTVAEVHVAGTRAATCISAAANEGGEVAGQGDDSGSLDFVEPGRDTNLLNIKPPLKLGKRGRPKGFGLSALGLPKKRKILRSKCNECRKDDPLRELSSGATKWTGCNKCERWFHDVCVLLPDDGFFICKFCS